ncbi:strawberry notch-like NTP hydrolase domain-containing protein [Yoonia sp. R2-816]|uniref:strawberry notch-like NTP hydrolase domain-containing protein n=1 Tax=Yoonia sp. R2-816 TaxID=3342638 RepID=UPI00372C5E38
MAEPKTQAVLKDLGIALQEPPLTPKHVSDTMHSAFGGTDAEGAWCWRQAYDVMQAAAVQTAISSRSTGSLSALTGLARNLLTESRRSEAQVRLQQFSTPLPYAWLVGQAAALSPLDRVLEPSAGTGALAAMAFGKAQSLTLNEIDPFRAELLSVVFQQSIHQFDAEHINDLLPGARPTVVLMNPPFSASAKREDPTMVARHLVSAALALEDGGRLAAIVPDRFTPERMSDWWQRFTQIVRPRLRIDMPGAVYRKLGTQIPTSLLVCDKTGDAKPLASFRACSIEEAVKLIAQHPQPRLDVKSSTPRVPVTARAKTRTTPPPRPNARPVARISEVQFRERDEPYVGKPVSDVFARSRPQRIVFDGAQEHPSPLVESLAMASVVPPIPGRGPKLPERLVAEGLISEAQLEAISMIVSAHDSDLPGTFKVSDDWTEALPNPEGVRYRQGAFLGDNTGVGKGRTCAATLMDGWLAGHQRSIWLSRSQTLIEDAIRDWTDIGGAPTDIVPLSRFKADQPIPVTKGILFATYATLRAQAKGGETRLEQLIAWAGEDFEGHIAFDEAHAMQNAAGSSEGRGTKPSQQGIAGLRLQIALPRARITYISATGATTVQNLAYASRLGIWGPGKDFPFPSRDAFVSAMDAGGVAAMEIVARDLKALGLYISRGLSLEGVEYDALEHALTPAQIETYNTYARAFKVIHQNLDAALVATGVEDPSNGTTAGAAKAAAKSRFYSISQRFFNHLLQGLKMPSVLAAIEDDIAHNLAPVIQIVSTGEALLDRKISETLASDDELTEAHLTPKEAIIDYLMTAFPVQAQELVEVEGTIVAQPLRDEDGRKVLSQEALEIRDNLLLDIQCLEPVATALDQLIWHFGEEKIAEVTGRSKRPVLSTDGRLSIEKRSGSANSAETIDFMSGQKPCLVFSDAGGTGRSYHASLSAKNQKRRRHYLIEPGWRADSAIQGLGRTHRTAQASAPFFRLCATNVHGESRFLSTISRRLGTMGALTRGARQATSNGIFRAEDNLESPIARAALRSLYRDLVNDVSPSMTYDTFVDWTNLKLECDDGGLVEDLPPMSRFLNRLIALPIDMQNALFKDFTAKIDAFTERAIAEGRYDVGLEVFRAKAIRQTTAEDLWTCPKTQAITRLIGIEAEEDQTYGTAQEALDFGLTPMRNAASGKVAAIGRPASFMDDDDEALLRRVRRPKGNSFTTDTAFEASAWEPISEQVFIKAWAREVEELPKTVTRQFYLLTGLLLPIWTRIPSLDEKIWRLTPDGGEPMIGRVLTDEAAHVLRARFQTGTLNTAKACLVAARGQGDPVDLGRGLTLQTRRVAGRPRLEIAGFCRDQIETLKSQGCFTEIIAHQLRVFVPDTSEAGDIVASIMGASVKTLEVA